MRVWYVEDIKELFDLPKGERGTVYIPKTNELSLIPIIRKTRLDLIQCDDPEKAYKEYAQSVKNSTPNVNKDRLEFIKKARGQYYKDLGIHPTAIIGDIGMGYEWDNGWLEFPQYGKVRIGEGVRIGAFTTVKKATLENHYTEIGDGCKIGSHCNIGHNVKLGDNCLLTHRVSIGGSCEIGKNVYFGQGCIIKNKVKIGDGAYIAQGANVVKDVEPCQKVKGNPARPCNKVND